jgi:hypothetical protein
MLAQDRGCGGIRIEAPRGEQANMAPVTHMRADARARFVEPHRQAARDEMRSGCEANGPTADHGNRQV